MKRAKIAWIVLAACLTASAVAGGVVVRRRLRSARSIEPQYLALAQSLEQAHRSDLADRLRKGCLAAQGVCPCAVLAADAGLDADRWSETLGFLDAVGTKCRTANALDGVRSEGLARAGQKEEAKKLAQAAIPLLPNDPHAPLAIARVAYDDNEMTKCRENAEKALALGRGVEAHRLIGRSQISQGDFQKAREHFLQIVQASPRDLEGLFSVAVCSDRLGHYHDAREDFLRVLAVDPKHVLARTYLVALTANAGAKVEAEHHLAKLEELVPPSDPTLPQLRQLIASVPDNASGLVIQRPGP